MILVTGGTGLVGSNLLRYLLTQEQSQPIRAIKRTTSKLFLVEDIKDKINWFDTDLLDPEGLYQACEGVTKIYHCAAVVSYLPSEAEWMKKVNVEGTANIVNIALQRGVKKLLHVSSIAAIGINKKVALLHEDLEWQDHPENTNYAISKQLAEREVFRGLAEGLAIVIVNPSIIIGKGDWNKGSCQLFKTVWDGLPFCTAGSNGFTDVDDLVNIMVQLMESDIVGERFIVNNVNLTFKQFLDKIATHLQRSKPRVQQNAFLMGLVWRWELLKSKFTKINPIITKESIQHASSKEICDNQKIKKTLNYSFKPIDESIAKTSQAFLKSRKINK